MANAAAIEAHIEQLVLQLQSEGVLDEQFGHLMQLQDADNPDFVAEVVQLYFDDSKGKIDKIGAMLASPSPDFNEVDQMVHQFKGSSASLGARMLAHLCVQLRECCQAQDAAGAAALHRQICGAYAQLQSKLALYLQLEAARKQAAG